jgi:FkbM family methyltransferase
MAEVRDLQFRNHPYKICCIDPPSIPTHPSWYSFVDEEQVRLDKWLVTPGSCILDVGAAYGSYLLTALAVGAAYGFAWSPQGVADDETEKAYLTKSLELNGWQNKATVYNSGVYDRDGWLNTNTQEFSVSKLNEPPADPKRQVPYPNSEIIQVSTLDTWFRTEFLSRFSQTSFPEYWMKLDVEGAEIEAILGGKSVINSLRPKIQVENHLFKRPTIAQEVRDLLQSLGYSEISTTPYHSISHSLYYPR